MQQLQIKPGERALFVGRTGSGKTTGMLYYAQHCQPLCILILDSKNDVAFDDVPHSCILSGLDSDWLTPLTALSDISIVIVRPKPEEYAPVSLDNFLYNIYETTTNVCVCIDELYMVHRAGRAGRGLIALLTRGRSAHITVLSATQRPTWLSLFCLSETDYYMIYRLKLTKDIQRMQELTHEDNDLCPLDNFGYWCYSEVNDSLVAMPPVPLSIRSGTISSSPPNVSDEAVGGTLRLV